MTSVAALNRRYRAVADLTRNGLEIVAVGDPAGARLNAAVRRLLGAIRDDGPGLWDDLAGAAKSLRWRLVTQPQPVQHNVALRHAAGRMAREARLLRGAVSNSDLLDELLAAASLASETDPPVGAILMQSVSEVRSSECVVVAASVAAQSAIQDWLRPTGVGVVTPGDLERQQPPVDQTYVVGPPRFFPSSLVTAPVTGSVSFLLPAWFGDRSVPKSVIADYAEGSIRIRARVFIEGDATEPPAVSEGEPVAEDEFLPEPSWGERKSAERPPSSEEVEARKVLLSGGLAIWLDDGDRIRTLEPRQPASERVTYTDIQAVKRGTYLLLRTGESERGALYRAAMGRLGSRGVDVDTTQGAWKHLLAARIRDRGNQQVVRELRQQGVRAADQARAWTDPTFVRPNRDQDFEVTLRWLGIPVQPTFGNATLIRGALHQANAHIRRELEAAVAQADLSVLEREGHLGLEIQTEPGGVRGILATRVLAISPHTEIVMRHDARVPYEDRGGQWLE